MHVSTKSHLYFLKQTAFFFFFFAFIKLIYMYWTESVCGILIYFPNSHSIAQKHSSTPPANTDNNLFTTFWLVNSPHSAGLMCSCELELWRVHLRCCTLCTGRFPFRLLINVDMRVLQSSDHRSVHPSILSLTVAISGCLRTGCRKQESYREAS